MDIRTLYRFLLLEENRSMAAAAGQAYMTRQAFSDSMLKLEEELGVTLLLRKKSGVEMTEEGRELLRFLKTWLPEWEKEQEVLAGIGEREVRTLHVGVCFSNLSRKYLEKMVLFETIFPRVKVEYEEFSPFECFSMLDEGRVDLALGLDNGERPGCVRRLLPETGTQPMLMMHRDHPLAEKEEIHTADLQGVPMVLVSKSGKSDPIVDSYAVPFGAIPVYVPIRNEPYTLNLMKVRGAVGLTSARNPNRFEEEGFIRRPLTDYPIDLGCYLYYKKTAPPVLREFVDYLLKTE